MPLSKPRYIRYDRAHPYRRERIRIPQPVKKPVSVDDRVHIHYVDKDAWYWTLHHRGVRRQELGIDPLEARAIPHSMVKGTLPERIVYRKLIEFHFMSGADFDFQSSLLGGRLELGGIVADFMMERLGLVLQVQGPTHETHLRHMKDEEQEMILASMGYRVEYLDDDLIYNEHLFDDRMRQLFAVHPGMSMSSGAETLFHEDENTEFGVILSMLLQAQTLLEANYG